MYWKSYGYNGELFLQKQWVENLKMFLEESHFSNIANMQSAQYPLVMFSLDTEVCGVNPKWIQKIKVKFENLNSKFKIWYKIEI